MDVGEDWAYRERASTEGAPICRVEIIQLDPRRRGKARVRFLDGDQRGLDEWVARVRLKVPWAEAEAWLDDERRGVAARAAYREALDDEEFEAAHAVFHEFARQGGIRLGWNQGERGLLAIDDLAAASAALGLDRDALPREPLAFVDRRARYIAPWPVAPRLARHLAGLHADAVVAAVAAEEARLREAAVQGEPEEHLPRSWHVDHLHERQPVLNLIRAWCGRAAVERFDEVTAPRAEVERLRLLIESAARWLDEARQPRGAARPRRELSPHAPGRH